MHEVDEHDGLPFFALELVFLIGFVTYIAIRGVFEHRAKGNNKVVRRFDWRERTLMSFVFIGCLLLPVIYLFTSWMAFADYVLPSSLLWVGAAVMVAALWLFWRAHADLGQNWSVTLEVREGHQLVKEGVYRRVRHPMYAAIFLFGLAQGLLLQNWLAGWSAIVSFIPLYLVRVPREERMMSEFFGQEYRDYMGQTGRVLPRIHLNRSKTTPRQNKEESGVGPEPS